jgi:peptidoglycan-associated lipoprotein
MPEVKSSPSMPVTPLVKHMLFFEYDSHALPANTQIVIAAHVRYLIQNPSQKILIEGSADESGDAKYNFALGLKRALIIKDAFTNNGIGETQLIAKSIGEIRPLNTQNKPHSLARNRRVQLVY